MEIKTNPITESNNETNFNLMIYAPFDSKVDYYLYSRVMGLGAGTMVPLEYTDWRDEVLSWKESCYIHTGLNPASTFRVKGPDAIKFFSDISVNSFANFPIGGIKHCIMCNNEGLLMTHGVLLRLGEEELQGYFLAPYAAYKFYTGKYNAEADYVTDEFIFQVAGPRSIEVLETATGECLHDIKFARHRQTNIADTRVRIARVGMAGTLAYEIHGKGNNAHTIYNAIIKAGESFGIKKLGFYAYQLSHTEDGFPQGFMHFPYPWFEDKGFAEFLKMPPFKVPLKGSMGTDVKLRYRNPVELGWAKTIKFDHEFIGRKALEKEIVNPRRAMVTLVWNPEDILDGSGAGEGTKPVTCSDCNGRGQVQKVRQSMLGQMVTSTACPRCNGLGEVIVTPCSSCNGDGRVITEKTFQVDVPAGVDTGSTLRLTGRGAVGPRGGGAGDLYVHIRVAPHELYRREGDDLVTTLAVSIAVRRR